MKVLAVLIYGLCVFISRKFADEYWVTGPVFGAAVLAVNFGQIRKKISPSHLVFVGASTLIYALVFWIADKGWKFRNDALDMLAGSLTAGVVVGSLLMPFIHAILLGVDTKTAQATALALIGSWYAVILLSGLDGMFHFGARIDYLLIGIALWQGIYLYRLKTK
jgi:hypothetical protein